MPDPVEHGMEQLSTAWFMARAGIATASRFGKIVSAKTQKPIKSDAFALKLATERWVGGPLDMDSSDGASGGFRGRGLHSEPRALAWYEFHRSATSRPIGLVVSADGATACSPDSLVDDDPEGPGGVEIKTPSLEVHARNLLALEDVAPWTQVQGSLYVTKRNWWDVMSWSEEPRMGPVLHRVYPVAPLQRLLAKVLPEFEVAVCRAVDMLEVLGKEGRVDGSELRLQLLASLIHGREPDPLNLTLDEVSAFADDVRRAVRLDLMGQPQADSLLEAAESGDPASTRDHWASLTALLEEK